MSFKKFTSTFLLTAVLSVFSCSGIFLWSEFSSHVLAQNEICSEEKHCLEDCLACEVSNQNLTLNKALPDKKPAESLVNSFAPEPLPTAILVFEIPAKNIVWTSPRPPNTHSFAYYGPHTIVKNVVIIV